ncbi:hypothetical protein D9613_004250 [Agrocybe pediades]|uniref:Uncharacterized protein n=1 Tax=Agrocybe pediades TaxID=84607 RepID=A0A8H4QK52_9AGAR|nr:hypothetical protein D9613_004250 [Agrocybe pediades]
MESGFVVFVSILTLLVTNHTSLPDAESLQITVVLLNWSRFANVLKITSNICENLLDDVVHNIIVWNNNPTPISFSDFTHTTCPESRLNIVNSPSNIYFEARYIACARAVTTHCFIQDDDYLVHPNIIRALAARMVNGNMPSIHLQPPDEMFTSEMRELVKASNLHTTFAWLGYGTIILRTQAAEFLSLLEKLQLSKEEHEMADNYFTILSNRMPERWFDPGIPLGGGVAFTVGTEGEERNNRHILRAAELLDQIVRDNDTNLPYVQLESLPTNADVRVLTVPCQRDLCILQSSIELLPDLLDTPITAATDILDVEKRRLLELGEMRKRQYLDFPPSNAVDGRYETVFRSPADAKRGDWIMLDLVRMAPSDNLVLEMVVGGEMAIILQNVALEVSQNGNKWAGLMEF